MPKTKEIKKVQSFLLIYRDVVFYSDKNIQIPVCTDCMRAGKAQIYSIIQSDVNKAEILYCRNGEKRKTHITSIHTSIDDF